MRSEITQGTILFSDCKTFQKKSSSRFDQKSYSWTVGQEWSLPSAPITAPRVIIHNREKTETEITARDEKGRRKILECEYIKKNNNIGILISSARCSVRRDEFQISQIQFRVILRESERFGESSFSTDVYKREVSTHAALDCCIMRYAVNCSTRITINIP